MFAPPPWPPPRTGSPPPAGRSPPPTPAPRPAPPAFFLPARLERRRRVPRRSRSRTPRSKARWTIGSKTWERLGKRLMKTCFQILERSAAHRRGGSPREAGISRSARPARAAWETHREEASAAWRASRSRASAASPCASPGWEARKTCVAPRRPRREARAASRRPRAKRRAPGAATRRRPRCAGPAWGRSRATCRGCAWRTRANASWTLQPVSSRSSSPSPPRAGSSRAAGLRMGKIREGKNSGVSAKSTRSSKEARGYGKVTHRARISVSSRRAACPEWP